MSSKNNDSDDSIEQAAERIFRNLSESRGGGGTPDGRVPSDPNPDDEEVPAHASISEGMNSTSADPVADKNDEADEYKDNPGGRS